MTTPPPLLKRWRFSAGVLAPAVLSVVATAAAVIGFVLWSTADIDARTLQRQRAMVAHVIADQIAKVPHDQQSVALWDDAVYRTSILFDAAWVETNLGLWMHDYFGQDRVLLLDGANRPVYAMDDGKTVDAAAFAGNLSMLEPLVARLRNKLATSTAAPDDGSGIALPYVADLTRIDGKPAIVSVEPILSDSQSVPQLPGSEFVHVSIVFLDSAHAAEIADQYLLANAGFVIDQPADPAKAVFPMMSSDGRFVTFFEWLPDRPGQTMLAQTAPALLAAFLVASLVIFLLLRLLSRSAAAINASRLSAQYQASHDALTGLPNRAQFDDQLAEALAERTRGQRVALLVLDLDRFKQVNDTLGHQAGDDLIRAVGQRLREIIGSRDMLARLGGDEFSVVHITRGGEREALILSHRIIDALSKPFEIFGSEAFVGVSIGVALAGEHDIDRLELARRADIALYEAKAAGRNRAVVFEEAMNEQLQGRHAMESELREALRRADQLSVAFQPLFSRETGRIKGAEALARWLHPTLGQVSPAHFIPVAEASDLIGALGEFVLHEACKLGAAWPGMTIAVNISPSQVRDPEFPERVFDLLVATGMRPQDLELEITESILLEDEQTTSEALATFRAAGIRIALDDFGTGYSSLNYLKRYPVDCIKIDRSFVSQLSPGTVSVAIVQAMVTLAHAMHIEVTAEGVETHEQMQILEEMGCNTFQGFLLSAPVDPQMIEGMFRNHGRMARPVAAVA